MSKKQITSLILIFVLIVILILWFIFFPDNQKTLIQSVLFGALFSAIFLYFNRKKNNGFKD